MGMAERSGTRRERQIVDSCEGLTRPTLAVKSGFTIIITGTTGNLGAYLVDVLLRAPNVEKLICLNRAESGAARQRDAMTTRGLEYGKETSKVSYIQVDLTKESFGLDEATYEDLVTRADLVLHNAWPVDFNRNFASFEASVSGVKHLIKFCSGRRPTQPCRLVFISSIAASSNWGSAASTSRAKIPESELIDWRLARTGYGQSKLLSERVLAHAAKVISLPATIIRVGQLGGPVLRGETGKWPEHEWVPSMIKSSATMGVLPKTLGQFPPLIGYLWILQRRR